MFRCGIWLVLDNSFQELIQLVISCLYPFRRWDILTGLGTFLLCFLDLGPDGAHIHGGKVKAFEDPVDLTGVLRTDHDVRKAVIGRVVLQHAVQNAVPFCLLAEFLKIAIPDGKDLQFLSAFQHVGKTYLAACFLLIPKDRVQQHGQPLGRFTADLSRDFHAVEAHPHDLFRCFP